MWGFWTFLLEVAECAVQWGGCCCLYFVTKPLASTLAWTWAKYSAISIIPRFTHITLRAAKVDFRQARQLALAHTYDIHIKCEVSERFWWKWPSVRRGEEGGCCCLYFVTKHRRRRRWQFQHRGRRRRWWPQHRGRRRGAAASTLPWAGIVSTARHDSSLLLSARQAVSNFKP